MGTGDPEQRTRVMSTADLAVELRRQVIRRGLPIDQRNAGEHLPHLRNVVARAIHPDGLDSRIDAFNELLPELVRELPDERVRAGALILFGIADGSARTLLTVRRARAAQAMQYDVDHFRKRVEPRICYDVAQALHRDLLRYRARTRRSTYAYEISRPTPPITREEVNAEEVFMCRIWQHVYELRAVRIQALLAEGDEALEQQHSETADTLALQLRILCEAYVDTYGRQYISDGKLDYAVLGLEKLVVWRIGLADSQQVQD